MAIEYRKAGRSMIEVVEQVIEEHHPDLAGARIGVISRETAGKHRGRRVMGDASRVSARNQVFMPYDFILCLAEDVWVELDAWQRRALVDHELCHCTITDNEEARMVPHDIEMFRANFERYGFWWPNSEQTQETFQARLGLEVEASREGGTVQALDPSLFTNGKENGLFREEDWEEEAQEETA